MQKDMKWIIPFLMLSLVFAQDFLTIRDNELFKIEITGVTEDKDVYELSETQYTINIESKKFFILDNYSISIKPKNLEKIAQEVGVPLSKTFNVTIFPGSETRNIEIPDLICGNYQVSGILNY